VRDDCRRPPFPGPDRCADPDPCQGVRLREEGLMDRDPTNSDRLRAGGSSRFSPFGLRVQCGVVGADSRYCRLNRLVAESFSNTALLSATLGQGGPIHHVEHCPRENKKGYSDR
jgi:hypothetical protein